MSTTRPAVSAQRSSGIGYYNIQPHAFCRFLPIQTFRKLSLISLLGKFHFSFRVIQLSGLDRWEAAAYSSVSFFVDDSWKAGRIWQISYHLTVLSYTLNALSRGRRDCDFRQEARCFIFVNYQLVFQFISSNPGKRSDCVWEIWNISYKLSRA